MKRTERIDLRVTSETKQALQAAANSTASTVSEFILSSALKAADEALANRRIFALTAEQWAAFHAALDAPPRPTPRLKDLRKGNPTASA